ncbi:transposase domain-containing protein [Nonomuraea sp. NPDC003707]
MILSGDTGGSGGLTDLVAVSALTSLIPRQVLDAAITMHGCGERRVRKLPAHVVVHLLIALCTPGQITRASCRPPGCRGLPPGRRRRGTSGSGRSTCARPAL